jgi:hypothetical protein
MAQPWVSPHVLSSQLLYGARLAVGHTAEAYQAEVYRRLRQLKYGLREWEYMAVQKEVECRLAAMRA